MEHADLSCRKKELKSLNRLSKDEQLVRLWECNDLILWDFWRLGSKEALITLYKKHHKTIIIRIYRRTHEYYKLTLVEVQDAFSEFMEKILSGKYKSEALRVNFEAFAIYHTIFLIRTKAKKKLRYPIISIEKTEIEQFSKESIQRVERGIDFSKVIDCIPLISNQLYRKVIYLILVLGYNSKDLVPFFGKPELAYDKRYRALIAFRKILKKEGLWQELQGH